MHLIDTHAHLTMKAYGDDLEQVIQNAEAVGVKTILDVGTDIESSRACVENARRFTGVFAAAGVHPHDAAGMSADDFGELARLLELPEVVALGEIGLDYHYDFSPRDLQRSTFKSQLELGLKKDIPLIIHVREAMEDALEILDDVQNAPYRGVFHCFGGERDHVDEVVKRGFHISFTGVVSFKNFNKEDVVRQVPADRLLIETDAPYMTPVPLRGKRNEPAYVRHVLDALAAILKTDPETLAEITTDNAVDLFGLESEI